MADSTSNNIAPKLVGKVAMITGGASGIGEATARLFADHGARMVVIADIQDEVGNQVAASIGAQKCKYVHCDVTDEDQVKHVVESTVSNYGQLDIMFSNAGIISSSEQTILNLDFSQYDKLLAVNTRGMVASVKHAARAMVEKHVRGSIICTASVVGSHGVARAIDYSMSKHAVLGLVRGASMQLGEYGIRVNSVSPNAIATPLLCKAYGMEMETMEKFNEQFSRLKGVGLTTKHVADAVLFLASDDSGFVSGHDLVVDGVFVYPQR